MLTRCFRLPAAFFVFLISSCGPASVLTSAPKPGITGDAHYDRDDNSTTERVSFKSSSEPAGIESAFEQYCRHRGLSTSRTPPSAGIRWYEGTDEALGILISPHGSSVYVTYFHASSR